MQYETVTYKKADNIARITLNRPEVLNALNDVMLKELPKAVEEASHDDEVRVLIITGAGHGFCAGGDHKFLSTLKTPQGRGHRTPVTEEVMLGQGVVLALRRTGKPSIAMVNGPAAGAGFDIALACDMRIGSENARFAVSFTKVGLVPATGTYWMLPRIVGISQACRLIFTGDPVGAEEAHRIGILDDLVPSNKLEEETMSLASKLAQGPPIATRFDKMLIYGGLETDLERSLNFGGVCQSVCLDTDDFREGLRAFAEKRKPKFQGK